MDVKGFLKEFANSNVEDQGVGFATLGILCRLVHWTVEIDTGTLVFDCAL